MKIYNTKKLRHQLYIQQNIPSLLSLDNDIARFAFRAFKMEQQLDGNWQVGESMAGSARFRDKTGTGTIYPRFLKSKTVTVCSDSDSVYKGQFGYNRLDFGYKTDNYKIEI